METKSTSGDAGGTATTSSDLALVARALGGGDETVEKQALQALTDQADGWTTAGAVTPRYPPTAMLGIVERSSILPQCLEAMANGIDGWGHTFEPVIDLAAKDVADQVRAAIVLEREADAREAAIAAGEDDWEADYDVPDAEVQERLGTLARQAPIQRFRVEAWFQAAAVGAPFVELRRRMRKDQYAVGHGVLEFARDDTGALDKVGYVAAHTLLPVATPPAPSEVTVRVPVSPISTRDVQRAVQFDVYLQQVGNQRRYFKALGDPRTVSQATGKVYKSPADLARKEGKRGQVKPVPATEVLYLPLHTPQSAAGEPNWVGQIPNVLGLRAAEEVNYTWFDDKCIPPGAWIIVGGTLGAEVRADLENHLRTKIKGRSNFYRPLIIELVAPPGNRDQRVEQPKVQWMSFRDDLHEDATHREYAKDTRNNIRSSFRLPRALTGDLEDALARANAYASLEFADIHVFSAPRRTFDWVMNTAVLPDLGITLWRFVSKGPNTSDPDAVTRMADVFANRGGLVPADVRALASQALNVPLPPVDQPWAQQPLQLSLAGLAAEQLGVPADQVGFELLSAFGPEGTPQKRELATGVLKDYFARCGYDLARVSVPDDGGR
jgi:capsid portal protein